MSSAEQSAIDEQNSHFWDELCGTQLAKSLGVEDDSAESLSRFDQWYFDLYPYLFRHIPFKKFEGKKVLEIGLGYGSVGQRIASSGAEYFGLDIAPGPVRMMEHRLELLGRTGTVRQGSVLEPPFEKAKFDFVVAIGCLHHTGDLAKALERVGELVVPGGKASIMVYNAASYRQWIAAPAETLHRLRSDPSKYSERRAAFGEDMRGAYDVDSKGASAPQTEFVTRAELRHMCKGFSKCDVSAENIGADVRILKLLPRRVACRVLGPVVGLDLYCELGK